MRERGLKSDDGDLNRLANIVAPVRERGLKCLSLVVLFLTLLVAPVRERGLKCTVNTVELNEECRSREGAWIEILMQPMRGR